MKVMITGITHRGLVRDHNEDCLGWGGWALNGELTSPISTHLNVTTPTIVVVSDGMGGHAGGETASRMATTMLTAPAEESLNEETVRTLLQHTSDAINTAGEREPHLTGMGCTVAGLVLYPDGSVLVFNVGDSRCYRVEGRYLAQLSTDHRQPGSGSLTQALGGGRRMILQPDFFNCELPTDPGLVMCTDGLDDYADFPDIEARALRAGLGLVSDLRDLALSGGGGDNVSIVQVCRADESGRAGG